LAALVLTSVALPPLLVAVRDATVRQAAVNQRTVARWLAHARIEEAIADRHSAHPARGYGPIVTSKFLVEPEVAGFPGFARRVDVVDRDHTLLAAGTGYKIVTVTVSWTDARSGPASLALQTVLTDY
jgi:hypothetical protein